MSQSKYALITGASGGIGSAIAHQLANAGYCLILQGRNEQALTQLEKELAGEHMTFSVDLTNEADRQQLLKFAFMDRHIDVLVNCAGISHFGSYLEESVEQISKQIQVNLIAPMLLTKAFIQESQSKPSTIVNVGSTLGAIGFPGFSSYCASKFGLRGFSESLARELSDSKVRIAYLAPRTTQTSCNNDQATAMNNALGNNSDTPLDVAQAFMALLNSTKRRKSMGWPERIFVRLNGLVPEIVDKAIQGKLSKIKHFLTPTLFTLEHKDTFNEKL